MATGARVVRSMVQPFQDLPDRHLFVREPAVEHAHQLGFRVVDHEMARHDIIARDVAVAIRGPAALVVSIAGLLQLAAAETLAQDGALVFGDGTLDLQQQLVVRIVRDRVLQECHPAAGAAEFLEQQDLIGIAPRKPVGAQYDDVLDGSVADGVTQSVETRPVEPCAAVSLVAEDMLLGELVVAGGDPGAQGGELAVDGLETFLALGRDAGIEGCAHGGLTSISGVG